VKEPFCGPLSREDSEVRKSWQNFFS
jgi:hypothetical protein